jgi:excisionase family DNA binding protein
MSEQLPGRGDIKMDELLSIEEAARRLGGLSKYTIHAWLSQGKLMRTKVGRRTMIRASELHRVIEDGGSRLAAGRATPHNQVLNKEHHERAEYRSSAQRYSDG